MEASMEMPSSVMFSADVAADVAADCYKCMMWLIVGRARTLLADAASEVDLCCLYIGVSMLNQSTL